MRLGETYLLRAEAYIQLGKKDLAAADINAVRARAHGRRLVEVLKKHPVITRNDSEFRTLPKFSRAVELVRNGRIGKVQRIYLAVPAELNGSALPPQQTMPVPEELNYDMWLGPAWEAPYTEKRVHDIR